MRFGRNVLCCALGATILGMTWRDPGLAQVQPAGGERAVIETTLARSLADGYREENIEKILSVYAPGARIVNYIYGEIDRETLGKRTLEDFSRLSGQKSKVDVLEVQITGDEALVTINFGVSGVFNGNNVSRQDRYYLRMRRSPAGWLVVEQSYRPDFKESVAPHGGMR
jgi:ketosteroid isomerase-like protein